MVRLSDKNSQSGDSKKTENFIFGLEHFQFGLFKKFGPTDFLVIFYQFIICVAQIVFI